MKKLIVVGLLIVGGLWVCKKTNLPSYASTLFKRGHAAVKGQIPRSFEIERVRNEVERLDADVKALLGPIAEKQAGINRLERETKSARTRLAEQREQLVKLTAQVEAGGDEVALDGAKARLSREFAAHKRADAHLKSQEKLLAAQRQTVQAAHEQLGKIAELKREFEVRLAQLEAAEETLALERLATPVRVDRNRVADIRSTLDSIQKGQEVEQIERDLHWQYGARTNVQARPAAPAPDLNEIKTFLGVATQNKVAQQPN